MAILSKPRWFEPIGRHSIWMLLCAWSLSGSAVGQTIDTCGTPGFDSAADTGLYLWEEDCGNSNRTFAVRALAGGSATTLTYEGRIDSSEPLLSATPLSLESNDRLELTDLNLRLSYRLNVGSPWWDGFRVSAPGTASLCFGASLPPGTQVLVGPDAVPVAVPFDLSTFESCSVEEPPTCGTPILDDATDTGLYLWEVSCGGSTRSFNLRALGNGGPSIVTYSGRVESSQAFGSATAYSLEPNDLLDLAEDNRRIDYRLNVASPWYDAFGFTAPSDSELCFGAGLPAGTQVRVGGEATPITVPFDLTTLESCAREEPIVCGAPTYDSATDAGLYLWEDNCGGSTRAFTAMALAGGRTGTLTYSGEIKAAGPLSGLTPISLESNDLLELVDANQRLNYRLNLGSPWNDGFRFTAPTETSLCFGADLPPGTEVRVGREAVPMTVPFDLLTLGACPAAPPPPPDDRMNIVVILTDDQRWDTLSSTPNIEALAAEGVSFSNAFVSYPVCGPVRASMLAGGFRATNTGMISNNNAIAPFGDFNDRDTLAVRLQQSGYQTLYVGKYLNGYPNRKTYVPPGWTRWMANNQGETLGWYNFTVTEGSSTTDPTVGTIVGPIPQYVTDFHRDEILSFLDTAGDQPFFIHWASFSPHAPATPADGDETLFSDYEYRERAWGETDLSDKPSWVTDPNRFPEAKAPSDEFHRDQLRSLQALDRGVDEIVEKIRAMGLADRTVFFILSDNGYQWGEHGLSGKGVAYEESLRVPFIVLGPGIAPGVEERMVLADLDLGPTIMEIAGLSGPAADGTSLKPLLDGQSPTNWRDHFLVESWGNGASGPYCTWGALRTERWKYILQASGEEELYDLDADPFEEESLHLDPGFEMVKTELADQLLAEKSLALSVLWPAAGRVGVAYSQPLTAWGGSGDYRWILESGSLPAGLTLNTETGLISGTPTVAGSTSAVIRVEDGTLGTHSGIPRQHRNRYSFTIRQ